MASPVAATNDGSINPSGVGNFSPVVLPVVGIHEVVRIITVQLSVVNWKVLQ